MSLPRVCPIPLLNPPSSAYRPDNILIQSTGNVLITDFGVARRIFEVHGRRGTRGYMAPEVRRREHPDGGVYKPPDGRADMWSLGVVLLENLVGSKDAVSPDEVDRPGWVLDLPPEADPLWAVLQLMLVADPVGRLSASLLMETRAFAALDRMKQPVRAFPLRLREEGGAGSSARASDASRGHTMLPSPPTLPPGSFSTSGQSVGGSY